MPCSDTKREDFCEERDPISISGNARGNQAVCLICIPFNQRVERAMLLLVFNVGNSLYAIESAHVVEVIPRLSYRKLHQVPEHVVGVFNYRSSIVPVIDLCRLMRGTPSQSYLSTRVMMVSYPRADGALRYIGLMAERVIETLDKTEADFKDAGIRGQEASYLGGIMTHKKGLIQQICLEQLLADVHLKTAAGA
ncbi:MAG: chemotaxis protein CheW [Leptolyngbya sp. BL-A-14]